MTEKATIQDVVDAIDRQTAVIERALEPRRLNIPEGEWDGKMPTRLLWASLPDVQPSEASQGTLPATDAPEPAQTLADLTPCLGDRLVARWEYEGASRVEELTYGWTLRECYGWRLAYGGRVNDEWTVVEPLDPVTPEEPPVGAGMLVDEYGYLWRRGEHGWQTRLRDRWSLDRCWDDVLMDGPLRPATAADLAEHGVDEWSVKTDEAGDRILMRNGVQVADEAAAERPEDFTALVAAVTEDGAR